MVSALTCGVRNRSHTQNKHLHVSHLTHSTTFHKTKETPAAASSVLISRSQPASHIPVPWFHTLPLLTPHARKTDRFPGPPPSALTKTSKKDIPLTISERGHWARWFVVFHILAAGGRPAARKSALRRNTHTRGMLVPRVFVCFYHIPGGGFVVYHMPRE